MPLQVLSPLEPLLAYVALKTAVRSISIALRLMRRRFEGRLTVAQFGAVDVPSPHQARIRVVEVAEFVAKPAAIIALEAVVTTAVPIHVGGADECARYLVPGMNLLQNARDQPLNDIVAVPEALLFLLIRRSLPPPLIGILILRILRTHTDAQSRARGGSNKLGFQKCAKCDFRGPGKCESADKLGFMCAPVAEVLESFNPFTPQTTFNLNT